MASGPITSWEIDGETVETVADFILGAPKLKSDTVSPSVSHEHYSSLLKFIPAFLQFSQLALYFDVLCAHPITFGVV